MRALLDRLVRKFIVMGRFSIRWPDGTMSDFEGAQPGPEATIAIRNNGLIRRLVTNPSMALGEGYMDQSLEPVDCTIYDVLDVLMSNMMVETSSQPVIKLRYLFERLSRRIAQFNPAERARRNVAHHYDLNGRTYSLFLDRDRQYSCAYFPNGNETLEEAQLLKKRHIAAKLLLDRPGLSVLDIGCGWGGMALTLARDYGARVTGITLSTEQLAEARARADAEGLSDRVSFEMLDYRKVDRTFDRIVSVGMFEHVGVNHYREFFDVVKRALAPDGVALIHAIGRLEGPGATNPWFTKYIFPGGYSPAISEVTAAAERSRLLMTDIEILRMHYAETLRNWRWRFAANRDAIAAMHDERFCRMFEYYLAGSELAFRRQDHMIWQLQLARTHSAVPLTRDYITQADRQMAQLARAAAD